MLPLVIPTAQLLTALFDDLPSQLTAAQRAVLDNDGNRNGFVDVGDVRRYLIGYEPASRLIPYRSHSSPSQSGH